MAKTIAAFTRYQSYMSFQKWKDELRQEKRRVSLIKNSILARFNCRAQHQAFMTWQKNLAFKQTQKANMKI